jgi:hypothetical protein
MSTRVRSSAAVLRVAHAVRNYLMVRGSASPEAPSLAALEDLIETAFLASLRTEESRPIVCTLAWAPRLPAAGDASEPQILGQSPRARIFPFREPLPLTVQHLCQLAPAANPATTAILVHAGEGSARRRGLVLWGLAAYGAPDESAPAESQGPACRPGLFQLDVAGVASLGVFDNRTQIVDLHHDAIASMFPDVLRTGEVHEALEGFADFGPVPADAGPALSGLMPLLRVEYAVAAVGRILARMQRFRHGGALLLARKSAGLHLKYTLACDSLGEAIDGRIEATDRYTDASYRIDRGSAQSGVVPLPLFTEQAAARARLDAFEGAVARTIGFIASLTRVDGLVLIGPGLSVRGFGVEITAAADPPPGAVVLADRARAAAALEAGACRRVDPSQFGTRHRSMMRHCYRDPDALGFVVSQDGEVRAMRRVGEHLVVWENLKLRPFEQVAPTPSALSTPIPAPVRGLEAVVRVRPRGARDASAPRR